MRYCEIHPHVLTTLEKVVREYPWESLVQHQLRHLERNAWHISLVTGRTGFRCKVLDLGGGICAFSLGCAALGMNVTLIDDFGDQAYAQANEVLALHRSYGVTVIKRDVIQEGIDLLTGSMDVITCFNSIEHWHHSPKKLFKQCIEVLKPGGWFILSAPNCVNLRKRVSVPLGHGKWSKMVDWYEQSTFRGHVREPDVDDLLYIAKDMRLVNVRILGRNWQGYYSSSPTIRKLTPFLDRLLRSFPSLCSDIY